MNAMTEEELEKRFDDIYESQRRIEDEFQKAKQLFKEKGIYKGDFSEFERELFDGLLYSQHIGYVNVEFLPNERDTFHRHSTTKRYFKISDLDNDIKEKEGLNNAIFSEGIIDVTDDDYCTYLVYQGGSFEDNYKGYVLLPMKDGKYWCFYYQC